MLHLHQECTYILHTSDLSWMFLYLGLQSLDHRLSVIVASCHWCQWKLSPSSWRQQVRRLLEAREEARAWQVLLPEQRAAVRGRLEGRSGQVWNSVWLWEEGSIQPNNIPTPKSEHLLDVHQNWTLYYAGADWTSLIQKVKTVPHIFTSKSNEPADPN